MLDPGHHALKFREGMPLASQFGFAASNRALPYRESVDDLHDRPSDQYHFIELPKEGRSLLFHFGFLFGLC
jgi:hypothetical protein